MNTISVVLQAIALFLFVLGVACFGAMLKGCFVLRRTAARGLHPDNPGLLQSPLLPPVSILAIPPDASTVSREYIRRLLALDYTNHEVVVVLNGASDADLAAWIGDFQLSRSARGDGTRSYEPRDAIGLVLTHKEPGTRASAWNTGVDIAASPIVALIDPSSGGDSALLLNLVAPMLEDETTAAVCGVAPFVPESGGWAATLASIESLRRWLVRGAAFAGWNFLLPVPGSSLLVRRDAVARAGGFRHGALDLVLSLHGLARVAGKPLRVALVPEPGGTAHPPQSGAGLRASVLEDQSQLAQAFRHSGPGGLLAIRWGLPVLFCVRWVRPLLETFALAAALAGWMAGFIEPRLVLLVLLSTVGVGIWLSLAAIALRELATFQGSDPGRLATCFFIAIGENLGYRQLRNLWLIEGWFRTPGPAEGPGGVPRARATPPAVASDAT